MFPRDLILDSLAGIEWWCCLLQEAGVELVAGVREGLKQRMMEVDWLDNVTRNLAIEKVRM